MPFQEIQPMTHEMMDASQSFIDFDEPIKEKTPLQNYEAFSESFISREIFSDTEQDLMHFQRMKNNMNSFMQRPNEESYPVLPQ